MPRTSMAAIIAKTRQLIGDKVDTTLACPNQFSDDEIQDTLDNHRAVIRYVSLRPEPTPQPDTGLLQYLDFYADGGYWEADALLSGQAWKPLTPAISDLLTGHWTFATSQLSAVYVTGKQYDVYGAAADLCEAWAAQLALQFDFSDQGVNYRRSQQNQALLKMADTYRAKAWIGTVTMMRSDTR